MPTSGTDAQTEVAARTATSAVLGTPEIHRKAPARALDPPSQVRGPPFASPKQTLMRTFAFA